jgi:hypothetical protein
VFASFTFSPALSATQTDAYYTSEFSKEIAAALQVRVEQVKDMKMNHAGAANQPQAASPSMTTTLQHMKARRLDASTDSITSAQMVLLPTLSSSSTVTESADSLSSRLSFLVASSSSMLRQGEVGKNVISYSGQSCTEGTTCNDMNGTPRDGADDGSSGPPIVLIVIIAGGVVVLFIVSLLAWRYFHRVRGEQRASTEAAKMEAGPDSSSTEIIPTYGQQTEMSERSWPPPPPPAHRSGPPPPPMRYNAYM